MFCARWSVMPSGMFTVKFPKRHRLILRNTLGCNKLYVSKEGIVDACILNFVWTTSSRDDQQVDQLLTISSQTSVSSSCKTSSKTCPFHGALLGNEAERNFRVTYCQRRARTLLGHRHPIIFSAKKEPLSERGIQLVPQELVENTRACLFCQHLHSYVERECSATNWIARD